MPTSELDFSSSANGTQAFTVRTRWRSTPGERKINKKTKSAAEGRARKKSFGELMDEALKLYLKNLNGHDPADLYQLVIGEVEKPLFKNVIDYADGNQSQAAKILGINRGTLRKKLNTYKLLEG